MTFIACRRFPCYLSKYVFFNNFKSFTISGPCAANKNINKLFMPNINKVEKHNNCFKLK